MSKAMVTLLVLVAGAWSISGVQAGASAVMQACLLAERSPGVSICTCAQLEADRILTPVDQAEAARLIADPDRFAKVDADRSRGAQAFLERYRIWGEMTEANCG